MSWSRSLLLAASRSEFLNRQATKRAFVRRAVRRFMPGERMEDALEAAVHLAREGRGALFTRLGENLTRLEEAAAVREHYLTLFDEIARRRLPGHVSVKPTQLGLDLSETACADHLEVLAAKAMDTGSTLWIDMEDSSYVDRTLALYEAAKRRHARVGLAIQAYLRRTPADIDRLMPLQPIVRLVKGAYAEPASVAYPAKADTDRAYFELGVRMLEAAGSGDCLPVFGTHDMRLVDRLIERASTLGLNPTQYEIHMLYGIRDGDQRALRGRGQTVKTLISYGDSWYKWYMRRLAERPANVWFVVRSMFG
jgi:proline dehydrogenase